jgi:uncharacterized protein (DUF2141 family)
MFFILTIKLSSVAQVSLTIEITHLNSNKGKILLELTDKNEKQIKGISEKIENNKCVIVIENLKSDKYAFKYIHDENKNEKLDMNWIGIPIEGYGFSNNAKGTFGPPSYEKTIFVLKEDITLKCTPKYY